MTEEQPSREALMDALANMTAARDSCLREIGRLHSEIERLRAQEEAAKAIIVMHRDDQREIERLSNIRQLQKERIVRAEDEVERLQARVAELTEERGALQR